MDLIVVEKKSSNREKDLIAQVNSNGCWNVISHTNGNPYPMYRKQRVHVLVYNKYFGDIPDGSVVRHKCDNYKCCNPNHLELGTQKDNVHDMIKRDRQTQVKLTDNQVDEILSNETDSDKKLARKYNVHSCTIKRIRSGFSRPLAKRQQIDSLKRKNKKLDGYDVLEIYNSKVDYNTLAETYNVSYSTIYDIKNGRTWSKITKHKKESRQNG